MSRQAVSKWESDQSYPEMDKVLLICKIFNYNIDELMNENVKEVDDAKDEKYDEKRKIFIQKKREKIIIRDPNQSQSKFLTGLFKLILNFIKFIVVCISLLFVFTFVGLFCLFVVSFMFVKTGFLFVGALSLIISGIIINFIILQLLYNFIISKKSPKTKMAMTFVISLILAGVGCGMMLIGISSFDFVEYNNNDTEDTYDFKMADTLYIQNFGSPIQYIEKDIKEVLVVIKHSKYLGASVTRYSNEIEIYCYRDDTKFMQFLRDMAKDINKKEIKDYYSSSPEIYVYASKDNIARLKQNKIDKEKTEAKNVIGGYLEQIDALQQQVYDLKREIQNKEVIIDNLKEQLMFYEN